MVNSHPCIGAIALAVCSHFGVPTSDLLRKRHKKSAPALRATLYISKVLAGHGATEVGRRLGGRDESSVAWAVGLMAKAVRQDERLRVQVGRLFEQAKQLHDDVAPHDEHVAVFRRRYPGKGRGRLAIEFAQCKCGAVLRRGDFARDRSGYLLDHCGCRTGVPQRLGTGALAPGLTKAEYQRQARLAGRPGYQMVRHDAHVRAHKLWLQNARREANRAARARAIEVASMSEEDRLAFQRSQYNALTARLSDGYVAKCLKKNMSALKGVKLPQPLIDLERARLMLVREVKEQTKP